MILRRLATAFRKQDWFTVVVETLIVLLGLVLGLQVNNWGSEYGRSQLEVSYTERLHEDVIGLQATRAYVLAFREPWAEGLSSAVSVIFGQELRELSMQECEAIAYSYIVTNPTDELASLIELLGSGQLSLFRNARVSKALSEYMLVRSRARDANSGVVRSITFLSAKYPDLVSVRTPSTGPGVAGDFACDVEAMRFDQGFLNDLETTHLNYLNHMVTNANVSDSLAELHHVLDEVLGLAHEVTP